MRLIIKPVGILALTILGATGCASESGSDTGRPLVVATTAVLGDVVSRLAGGALDVETLMPRGADPHSFEASARQAARLRDAELIVANGLGLEERLLDTVEAARGDGVAVLEIGPLVDPLPIDDDGAEHENEEHEDEEHEHGEFDPHVWMDPLRIEQAAEIIGEQLDEMAPGVDWPERVDGYEAEIRATHEEIEQILSPIPAGRRKLVTDHDSLSYFAARYGFEVVGTVVPGTSTLGAPSAGDLAGLADLVSAAAVPAIFVETSQNSRLADALAGEVGADVEVVSLHAGTLGEPSSPAGTYLGMLVTDARRIAGALS